MSTANKLLLLLSVVMTLLSRADAQQWSYQGRSMCYSYSAGSMQCYSSGTIQQYANTQRNFEAQFEVGRQIGEGVGSLVGSLLSRWAEHRRRVNAERTDLKEQIRRYWEGIYQLQDELITQETAIEKASSKLADLVPGDREFYLKRAEASRRFMAVFRKYKAESPKNTDIILGAKNVKFLRENAEQYKKHYEIAYTMASRGYVYVNLMEALVGYYESQASTPRVTHE